MQGVRIQLESNSLFFFLRLTSLVHQSHQQKRTELTSQFHLDSHLHSFVCSVLLWRYTTIGFPSEMGNSIRTCFKVMMYLKLETADYVQDPARVLR